MLHIQRCFRFYTFICVISSYNKSNKNIVQRRFCDSDTYLNKYLDKSLVSLVQLSESQNRRCTIFFNRQTYPIREPNEVNVSIEIKKTQIVLSYVKIFPLWSNIFIHDVHGCLFWSGCVICIYFFTKNLRGVKDTRM